MVSRKTSRATKLSKRLYILIQVTGGGDARQAEYAVLTLDPQGIDLLLKRCALSSALKTLEESVAHVTFHGGWCEWLEWSEPLESSLDGKDLAVLSRRPRGKRVDMDGCYLEVWGDGDVYFTGYERRSDGQPTWQAGPVPRAELEECKQRLAPVASEVRKR